MIDRSTLTRIGTLVKPHGIKGEISALFATISNISLMSITQNAFSSSG